MPNRFKKTWIVLIILVILQLIFSMHTPELSLVKEITLILAYFKFITIGFLYMDLQNADEIWKKVFLSVSSFLFTMLLIISTT